MRLYEFESPSRDINEPITQTDLNSLEAVLDKMYSVLGMDVEFTKHFLDRVNDPRNKRQITIKELFKLFQEELKVYGKKIAQSGPDFEAVMNDMSTDLNVPFILKWNSKKQELEIVSKTIMRKDPFMTPDPKLIVGKTSKKAKTESELKEWIKKNPEITKEKIQQLKKIVRESLKAGTISGFKINPNPPKRSDPFDIYRDEFKRHKQDGTLKQNIQLLRDWREVFSRHQMYEEFDDNELNEFLKDYKFDNTDNINFVAEIYTQYKTTGKKFMQIHTKINTDKTFDSKINLDTRLKYKNVSSIGFETIDEMELFITSIKLQFLGDYIIKVTGIL